MVKPVLSVSCLCENGVEAHLAKESFLRFGDGHEPLIRKGGVYFVKAQTVNACVRADGCTEKTREYNLTGDLKIDAYELMGSQKTTSSAKAWASKRRLGRMKHVTLKCMYLQSVEKHASRLKDIQQISGHRLLFRRLRALHDRLCFRDADVIAV